MKTFDPVEVVIDHLGEDGCGYPKEERQAVFGALPGETVLAVPVARKRRRHYLRTTEVVSASGERVQPACSAAAFCGGCSYQHLAHPSQLAVKEGILRDALHPVQPAQWLTPLSASPYHYRSKARLGVKLVRKKGRVLVGFREKMKPYIAETDSCPVLIEPVSGLIEPLARLIESLDVPEAIPQVELASGDDDIALIFRHLQPLTGEEEKRFAEFGEDNGLQVYLQPGGISSTHRIWPAAGGEAELTYRLPDYGLTFAFSPQDFTQVNLPINREMVALALDLLDLSTGDRVFDAFCGIGNFSLAIASRGIDTLGAESALGSVQRARENASRNGIENALFETMDLHDNSLDISCLAGYNKVLLDPPRSGAEALSKVLASSDVGRVVYVSCNPLTLARDVKFLVQNGFELRRAGIIDMFPHTTHLESIALLVRESTSTQATV